MSSLEKDIVTRVNEEIQQNVLKREEEVPLGFEKMRGGKSASYWRDSALEAAARIAEAYHSHPGVAADIRAMKSTNHLT